MSDSALELVQPIIESEGAVGIVIDFDSTLCEFGDDPDAVTVSGELQNLLEKLPGLYALVAIVSARNATVLAEKVRSRFVRLAGLNGAQERLPDGSYLLDPELRPWTVRASACARSLWIAGPLWRLLGITVEGKLTTVSLHYRAARWKGLAEQVCRLVGWVARRCGFDPVMSPMELEIRPWISIDKGEWLKRTVAGNGLKAVIFMGGGENDLAAIAAVRHLVDTGVLTYGVCFAVGEEETPDAVRKAADCVLPGIAGVTQVLDMLVRGGRVGDS
jgi:trehalose-phosphatase